MSSVAATPPGPCQPLGPDGPLQVTGTCDDPLLSQPYTDIDEQRTFTDSTDAVVSYRYIHGGFTGTNTRFSYYFPPADRYEGRFFQATYPTSSREDAPPSTIAFALANGAYVVSSNNNGGLPAGIPLAAYRSNAAAAKYSRVVAAQVYPDTERPRGYIYGASGGAYQTVGSVENTEGVWDGAVPMVPGTPNSIPSNQSTPLLGLRVLNDALPRIVDALEPGGSGDPYAGLTAEQREVLDETRRLGFPIRGWWQYQSLNGGLYSVVADAVTGVDPDYATEFWTEPGYEGTTPAVRAARVQSDATITGLVGSPSCTSGQVLGTVCPAGGFELSPMPAPELLTGARLTVTSGSTAGSSLQISTADGNAVYLADRVDDAIRPGDTVRIDNSEILAAQYYPRHQVPTPDMYGWNQYRDPDGEPVHPQRDQLVGTVLATVTGGAPATGRFHGKMIMLASVMDTEAFAWSADWYREQADSARDGDLDDDFRLWFTDNAGHTEPRSTYANTHIVDYEGQLQQALLDLDAWVSRGTPPPASTTYTIDDHNAVELPPTAAERNGVQPVVTLKVGGSDSVRVTAGSPVEFTAESTLPDGTGEVVNVEWDFAGTGAFPDEAQPDQPAPRVTMTATHTYATPGTYFAVVRVAANRDGDPDAPYGRILNLARVRVIVE